MQAIQPQLNTLKDFLEKGGQGHLQVTPGEAPNSSSPNSSGEMKTVTSALRSSRFKKQRSLPTSILRPSSVHSEGEEDREALRNKAAKNVPNGLDAAEVEARSLPDLSSSNQDPNDGMCAIS